MTDDEKLERQLKMFGTSIELIKSQCAELFSGDKLTFALSILSDSQELVSLGRLESARHLVNQAKWLICEQVGELKEKQ